MGEEHNEHELEQWLDQAIEGYGTAEPRVGLEGRVLARLQAESSRAQERPTHWWWALGLASAAVIVTLFWIGLSSSKKSVGEHSSVAVVQLTDGTTEPNAADHPKIVQKPQTDVRKHSGSMRHVNPARPKLNQFPSPQPLTEQEAMLARYIEEFPERAVLVARAQTKLRKEEELEMGIQPIASGSSMNLDQQQ